MFDLYLQSMNASESEAVSETVFVAVNVNNGVECVYNRQNVALFVNSPTGYHVYTV